MNSAGAELGAAVVLGLLVGALVTAVVYILRRRAERRLEARIRRETQQNKVATLAQVMHFALESAPWGFAVVDHRADLVLSNRTAQELGVVDERRLAPEVWRLAQRVFDDGEPRDGALHPGPTTVGPLFSVAVSVKRLTTADDRFVVVYSWDNSEQVRMESARRDFVANVSHELKTPVGAISLLVETLLEASDDPAAVEYFGQKLGVETQRISTMIAELIGLSKLQGAESLPDPRPVNVDDVVDRAVERSTMAAEVEGLELRTDGPCNAQLMGDEGLLVTAVTNLISNAINYSPEDTPVTVTRAVRGESVVIRVTDRGTGIPKEEQKRVFERFYRADKARSRATGGTGLGLAVVKHTVINHGGNVSLWSRPGTGSTFSLEFPVLRDDDSVAENVPDQDRFVSTELLPGEQ